MTCIQTILICALSALPISTAYAQTTQPPPDPATETSPDAGLASDPDIPVDPLQPDFTLSALPTTLRVPKGKMGFRITHRFSRSLGRGDFGDLLEDFFGFDNGAQIGLELRYGLFSGTQIGIHRTSDRTIQLFGQQNLLNERAGRPMGLDLLLTLEGDDNLTDHRQSAVGLIMSKAVGKAGSLYVEPIFVANTNPFDTGDKSTFMVGLGTRLRLRPKLYVVGEVTPRLAGYDPGVEQVSFGIEGRTGGHSFQINVSNGFGTTYGQLARGGLNNDSWFIGFNISRKFF